MTPKVLVISNECFSKTSSNGRTLGNFFVGWPKDKLAQFYLTGTPDDDCCDSFFQVSDRQALNAILKRGSIGGEKICEARTESKSAFTQSGERRTKRNALTMLGRNAIWKTGAWQRSGYWDWVNKYQPDVILLQAGDCAFMYDIAVKTAQRQNARLVIYNSEGYYYKDFDYFRGTGLAHILYPAFRMQLRKSLENAYGIASCVIYICDELKEAYAKDFHGRAETVFTGSDVQFEEKNAQNEVFTTVYCGNLGLKRHESLIDIAEELQRIDESLFVDVYGKANAEVETALEGCKGIHYHGLVPYEEVKRMLRDSDLLLYVESFDEFYQEDIKFGFSTKIADSLSCGNCFLLYSPEHFACHQYLKNNQAAFTAANRQKLATILDELVHNPESREKYREKALTLAEQNHRIAKNNMKFQTILREAASEEMK